MKCKECKAELEDYPITIFGVGGGPDIHAYAYKCINGCKEPMPKCRFCGETEYYTKEKVGEMTIDVVHCPNKCKDPMSDIDNWCYQIIKHKDKTGEKDHTWYGLHEIYKDKDGNMVSYTLYPEAVGDSVAEIQNVLNMMRHDARTKRVICVDDTEATALPTRAKEAFAELKKDMGIFDDSVLIHKDVMRKFIHKILGHWHAEELFGEKIGDKS